MGDVTHIYDTNGTLKAKYVYDAWGNHKIFDSNGAEITSNANVGVINPIRYRGYYYDTETGLYYLEARYYDPETGRFISQDSIDFVTPENLAGLNLYVYCANNPVMYVDRNGHDWWNPFSWNWQDIGDKIVDFFSKVGNFVSNTFGAFVRINKNIIKSSNDSLLFGYETGINIGTVWGDNKPISVYAEKPDVWWKLLDYKVGISINIGDFSLDLGASVGEATVSLGWNSKSIDLVAGIDKIGIGFSEATEYGSIYSQVYIRTMPTAVAVIVAVASGGAYVPAF